MRQRAEEREGHGMTKNTYYMHIPLWVTAFYMDWDKPMPRSVYFDHKEYKITKVISSGEKPPAWSRLPVRRYLVEINGVKKALYYDVKHNRWYSLKRISEEKAKEIKHARGQGYPEEYFRSVIEARKYLSVQGDR